MHLEFKYTTIICLTYYICYDNKYTWCYRKTHAYNYHRVRTKKYCLFHYYVLSIIYTSIILLLSWAKLYFYRRQWKFIFESRYVYVSAENVFGKLETHSFEPWWLFFELWWKNTVNFSKKWMCFKVCRSFVIFISNYLKNWRNLTNDPEIPTRYNFL